MNIIKIFILIFFTFFVNCTNNIFLSNLTPKAHAGLLNLEFIDFEDTQGIRLDGEWKFYWNTLLSEDSPQHFLYKQVPDVWSQGKQPFPAFGYASYSLEVILPKELPELGIYCEDAATSFRIFWNDQLVLESGKVAKTLEEYLPSYKSKIGTITNIQKRNQIIVEIANFQHYKSGLWKSIVIGKKANLEKTWIQNGFIYFFCLGCFWITSLFYISLYSRKRNSIVELYFAIFCFFAGWRFLVINEKFIYFFFPNLNWNSINFLDFMSLYLATPSLVLLIYNLFIKHFSKNILRVYLLYSILLIAMYLILPSYYASMTRPVFQVGLLTIFTYILGVYIKSISSKEEEGYVAFSSFVLLFFCMINYILYYNLILSTKYHIEIFLTIFMFAHSFLLLKRTSKAFSTSLRLAERLRKTNKNLHKLKLELEQKVQERTKELLQEKTRVELIGRMTSEIVHDLKTPISTILGLSEMANLDDIGKEARMEYLEIIQSESIRLADMSQGILDYVRGGARVEAEEVNLQEFSYEIYRILKPEFRNTDIEFFIDTSIKGFAVFDKELMRRVILNISTNALEALIASKKENKKFTIEFYFEGENFVMKFSDNALGISEEIQDKVFEPFVSYGKKKGTGLGMALVKEIIESHQGNIYFITEKNVGTTFFVKIPQGKEVEQNTDFSI